MLGTWEVAGPGRPDLSVVADLARWHLCARRAGGSIHLRAPSPELASLLDLVGLLRKMTGQPEGRKQLFDVEEGMQSGDPPP